MDAIKIHQDAKPEADGVSQASATAPNIFFEHASFFLQANGIGTIGLTVRRILGPKGDKVDFAPEIVANLKGNRQALESLRGAIDAVLLMDDMELQQRLESAQRAMDDVAGSGEMAAAKSLPN